MNSLGATQTLILLNLGLAAKGWYGVAQDAQRRNALYCVDSKSGDGKHVFPSLQISVFLSAISGLLVP